MKKSIFYGVLVVLAMGVVFFMTGNWRVTAGVGIFTTLAVLGF